MNEPFVSYAFQDYREGSQKYAAQYAADMARLMGADEENLPFLIQ